jgi:hypothetical protein
MARNASFARDDEWVPALALLGQDDGRAFSPRVMPGARKRAQIAVGLLFAELIVLIPRYGYAL